MFDRISTGRWWDIGVNLVTGCTPVSESCRNCWAKTMHARHGKRLGLGNFSNVFFHSEHLKRFARKKPSVFSIWNDLFHEGILETKIFAAISAMVANSQNIFLVLTKRIKRAAEILTRQGLWVVPKNLWIGTTVENQTAADTRIPWLLQIPATVRFLSVEPMFGPVKLGGFDGKIYRPWNGIRMGEGTINWCIVGCESGPGARATKIEWVRDLRDQCQTASIPFFLKQLKDGKKLIHAPELDGLQWLELPKEIL